MHLTRRLFSMAANKIRSLESFTACDISDALLKLKVPRAGFIPDLAPFAPNGPFSSQLAQQKKTIGVASTVLFVPKSHSQDSSVSPNVPSESNIPENAHYVDLTTPDTIVVLGQPKGQYCAVLGGIMALRMQVRGANGIVVGGRVRDLRELRALDFPIWAAGTSTVGAGAETKPWAIDVPIEVQGTEIKPGDIVFADPVEGVVIIPQNSLDAVIDLLPKLTGADDKVKEDVKAGGTVHEAFKKHR